jgi:hypothetical protein
MTDFGGPSAAAHFPMAYIRRAYGGQDFSGALKISMDNTMARTPLPYNCHCVNSVPEDAGNRLGWRSGLSGT